MAKRCVLIGTLAKLLTTTKHEAGAGRTDGGGVRAVAIKKPTCWWTSSEVGTSNRQDNLAGLDVPRQRNACAEERIDHISLELLIVVCGEVVLVGAYPPIAEQRPEGGAEAPFQLCELEDCGQMQHGFVSHADVQEGRELAHRLLWLEHHVLEYEPQNLVWACLCCLPPIRVGTDRGGHVVKLGLAEHVDPGREGDVAFTCLPLHEIVCATANIPWIPCDDHNLDACR
mmetsp:Transcript_68059/g.183804  ORF Transcript_68059/g.183804 Transcript_68059/m.183804 type:complete len:228 (-) Transcript_68059:537-1220(-)